MVPGFRASGIHCGIKARERDLALIVSDRPASIAGVFTDSTVVGAPIEWCRDRVFAGRGCGKGRGVVVNSGISNVAMGARGRRDAAEMAKLAARATGAAPHEFHVASTGVIGEPVPMACLRRGIPRAAAALAPSGLGDAAEAIRTTDTFAKLACTELRIGARTVCVAGIAKGSGMIEPRMATLLAFLLTDAAVAPTFLRRVLRDAVDASFNRISIDGEQSTSDTVLLFANGHAGQPSLASARSPGAARFRDAVGEVAETLARDLARDGEGATKLVTVEVSGAKNPAEAERCARRIANSLLVKTALFGGDANWGRILQTVGAGRIEIRPDRAQVKVGGVAVFRRGRSTGPQARRRAAARLDAREVELAVHLGTGRACSRIWTCDLSTEYVRINAATTT